MIQVDKILRYVAEGVVIIGLLAMLVFAGLGIRCIFCHRANDTPIEEHTHIDSLITVNDSIKLEVEHLDSIKNAKVIEVKTLDNDSTIKLFYELVSE